MRIYEVDSNTPGTYASVNFDQDTIDQLVDFQTGTSVDNPVSPDSFHATVIYSRIHLPDYKPEGDIDPAWQGKFLGFEILGGDEQCLVLRFDCPEVVAKFEEAMRQGATYDYDEYKPHITLAYGVGEDFDLNSLPDYTGPINIVHEKSEDLELEWDGYKSED